MLEKIRAILLGKFDTPSLEGLRIFQFKNTIYLLYKADASPDALLLATSDDGLDFQLYTRARHRQYKDPDYQPFSSLLEPRPDFFDHTSLTIQNVFEFDDRTVVLYHVEPHPGDIRVGRAQIEQIDGQPQVTGRSATPLWKSPTDWQEKNIRLIGTVLFQGKYISYWQTDEQIWSVIYPNFHYRSTSASPSIILQLQKHRTNPLLTPNANNPWEAFCTFNPAAVHVAGRIHLLYRAQGHDWSSVIGLAISSDGVHIEERLDKPIYIPSESFEFVGPVRPGLQKNRPLFDSGGYGGAEDPRVTLLDDRLYMTYVAYNGLDLPRVALTSIRLDDFLQRKWLWQKPVLISPPGVVDKSCVIFPEKINGKYVIMHRIYPNILIDFVDDLNFDGKTRWLKGEYQISPRPDMWDSRKIGAGAPPVKTPEGWLLIYQAVDERDSGRYKMGAMLLDLHDPTKVIGRSPVPILEPLETYENNGFKAGVVYPCGAVAIGDTLFVYYGGADSHVCVATTSLSPFVSALKNNQNQNLEPAYIAEIYGSNENIPA